MKGRVDGVVLTNTQQEYLLPHFLMLVVGKPGSGKSFAVQELATSSKYYGGKFNKTLVVSPSAQKLGINVSAQDTATEYHLEWVFKQIHLINQQQIQRFQGELRAGDPKGILRHIPQEVLVNSLQTDVKNKKPSRLPPEYIQFNRNQRFFTIETLAMMKQGWTALSKLQASANQPTPTQQLQQASESLVKGTKRKSKAAAKASEQNGSVFDNTYGVYKDADDIEKQLVSKLSETSLKKTRYNMLLILDDVIGDIKAFENNPMQQKLFFNRRHLIANGTISIIIVSQKYTMCPSRIRSNCSWLLLFRLNPVDFENVYKDVIMMGQERWQKLVQQVFGTDTTASNTEKKQKSYDNLGIWVEYDMFFKDFQKLNIQ